MKKFMILLACVLGCEGNTTQPSSKPDDAQKPTQPLSKPDDAKNLWTLPAAWKENQVKAARDYFGRIYTVTGKVYTIKPGEVDLYPIPYDASETAPKGEAYEYREDDGHKTYLLLVKCVFHLDDDKIIALKVGEATTLTGKLTGFRTMTLEEANQGAQPGYGNSIYTFDKP